MACTINGKTFIQVWHIRRATWVYIPVKKWFTMTDRQRRKYDTTI